MGRIVLLLFLLNLALVFAAIVDCLGGEQPPRRGSRLTWSLFIVFGVVVGPIAWFMYGRPGKRLPAPWDNIGPSPSQPRALAPDDDPDFLANLPHHDTPAPSEPDQSDGKPAPDQPDPESGKQRPDPPQRDADGEAVRDQRDERDTGG